MKSFKTYTYVTNSKQCYLPHFLHRHLTRIPFSSTHGEMSVKTLLNYAYYHTNIPCRQPPRWRLFWRRYGDSISCSITHTTLARRNTSQRRWSSAIGKWKIDNAYSQPSSSWTQILLRDINDMFALI